MTAHAIWLRALTAIGLFGMLIGVVDPLEGSFAILAGIGLVTLAAVLGGSRWRILLVVALALVSVGVGAMVVLSVLGGIGGDSGHSIWWATVMLPYPVGWIIGMAGVILLILEHYRNLHRTLPAARHTGPAKHP